MQIKNSEEGMPCPGPSKAVPEKPQSQSPLVKHVNVSQCWRSTFWSEGGHCLRLWDTLQDAEEEHLGIAQDLVWDGLEEEPKSGKGRDLTGLGRNKHGKIEGKGDQVASPV